MEWSKPPNPSAVCAMYVCEEGVGDRSENLT